MPDMSGYNDTPYNSRRRSQTRTIVLVCEKNFCTIKGSLPWLVQGSHLARQSQAHKYNTFQRQRNKGKEGAGLKFRSSTLFFSLSLSLRLSNLIYSSYKRSPHSIEQGSVLHDPQQLVGHGHVVGHRLFTIVEKGIRGPDFAGHQVVEAQDVHRPVEL